MKALSRARLATVGDLGHLIRSSGTYMASVSMQALGGFVFWIIAANRAPTDVVGLAAALSSSLTFILYATNLGLGLTIGRYAVGDSLEDRQRFQLAAIATAVAAALGTVVYLFILRQPASQPVSSTLGGPAILALAAALTALGPLVDVRLLTLRSRRLVILRGAFCGVVRVVVLLLVPLSVLENPVWVFGIMALPDAVTALGATVFLARGTLRPALAGRWRPPDLAEAIRYGWMNFASQLALLSPIMILPVVVLVLVTPVENAAFYVPWSITAGVCLIPTATLWALHLEGGRDGAPLDRQLRFSLLASVGLTTFITVLSVPLSALIPVLYGEEFTESQWLLPWLILGTVPWSVAVVYLSEARVRNHGSLALATSFTNAGLCLGLGYVLTAQYGVGGAAAAWVVGSTLAAVVAGTGRAIIQRRVSAAADQSVDLTVAGLPLPAVAVEDAEPDGDT